MKLPIYQIDALTLDFPTQVGTKCDIPEVLVEALGEEPKELYKAMDYMAVFDKEETISAIEPNFQLLTQLNQL